MVQCCAAIKELEKLSQQSKSSEPNPFPFKFRRVRSKNRFKYPAVGGYMDILENIIIDLDPEKVELKSLGKKFSTSGEKFVSV